MSHGDDLERRFNDLVEQIDAEERRKMRTSAAKQAKGKRQKNLSEPAHWSDPPPWEEAGRKSGRGALLAGVLVVLIAAVSVVAYFRPALFTPTGAIPEETTPVTASAEETQADEAQADEAQADEVPSGPVPEETEPVAAEPAGPFEGSRVEDWAEGAAAFVPVRAKALGGLSKKEVAQGLEHTRDLMTAAYLDRKTLLGGKPTAFTKLLDPAQRAWFAQGLSKKRNSTRNMVSSFAPKTAVLATDVVKVKGKATLGTFEDEQGRGVDIKLNHIIVYAVHRPGQPDSTIRLRAHVIGRVRMFRDEGRMRYLVTEWTASRTPARCDVRDGYIHPLYDDSPADKVGASGPPSDPYELEKKRPEAGCVASEPT